MDLKHLTDQQLLKDTEILVKSERELSTRILHHLKEIDRRKLYCDLKCSSLFDYCIKVLKLTHADAQRKIQSSRLLEDLPELEGKIEVGALSLTNLANAASFFKQQDIKTPEEKKIVLTLIENLSTRECEKKLFEISGEKVPVREIKKRIDEHAMKVSMILSDWTLKKMETLTSLIGRKLTSEQVIGLALDMAIANVEKKKFKSYSGKKSLPALEVTGRYIPASMKGEVYRRDRQCTNCGSLMNLNYDHQIPFALGGKTSTDNLRLLCFQCNQRARIRAKL